MSNLRRLHAVKAVPDRDIVAALEAITEVARRGEITSFAIAMTLPDGGIATQASRGHTWALIGALRECERRLLAATEEV
jgi:hypothetical protein